MSYFKVWIPVTQITLRIDGGKVVVRLSVKFLNMLEISQVRVELDVYLDQHPDTIRIILQGRNRKKLLMDFDENFSKY